MQQQILNELKIKIYKYIFIDKFLSLEIIFYLNQNSIHSKSYLCKKINSHAAI